MVNVKNQYSLELLTTETQKLPESSDDSKIATDNRKKVPKLEAVDIFFAHCNIFIDN